MKSQSNISQISDASTHADSDVTTPLEPQPRRRSATGATYENPRRRSLPGGQDADATDWSQQYRNSLSRHSAELRSINLRRFSGVLDSDIQILSGTTQVHKFGAENQPPDPMVTGRTSMRSSLTSNKSVFGYILLLEIFIIIMIKSQEYDTYCTVGNTGVVH